jgi:hypothetical protein
MKIKAEGENLMLLSRLNHWPILRFLCPEYVHVYIHVYMYKREEVTI